MGPGVRVVGAMPVTAAANPFFSICVPQFNRTSFVIEACRSVAEQTFRDFELCISDDCSTDGRSEELRRYLHDSGVPHVYMCCERNLRYDGNLRSAIGLARGRYCFLLGNDDALAAPTVLAELHEMMLRVEAPGVVITNYKDYVTGRPVRRVRRSRVAGSGPQVAAGCFRNFGFVSGVILDAAAARRAASDAWDGSEYYQMFLGCRIIASGKLLVECELVTIRKDIQLAEESVESYRDKPVPNPGSIIERPTNLLKIGSLVLDAVGPYANQCSLPNTALRIYLQILVFTYGFWIFEFRRVHSWKYAAGFCLAMRPRRLLAGKRLGIARRSLLALVHGAVTAAGLLIPVVWFERLYPSLHRLAKSAGRFSVRRVRSEGW